MAFTDPPYAIFGTSTGMKRDINMITPFFRALGLVLHNHVKLAGNIYIMCDWRTYPRINTEIEKWLEVRNVIVWDKGEAGYQGSSYSNTSENIVFATNHPTGELSMYEGCRNEGMPKHRAIYSAEACEHPRKTDKIHISQPSQSIYRILQ